MIRWVLGCLVVVMLPSLALAQIDAVPDMGARDAASASGGSNYLWFAVDPVAADAADPVQACIDARDRYGILANYHRPGVRRLVQAQLRVMRAAGQDRIATGIIHLRAPAGQASAGTLGGTLLDSTGGRLYPPVRQRLIHFLADIRAAGFSEVLFRYFPQGDNTPLWWTRFDEGLFEENWQLIRSIEPVLRASGLNYRTDLMVEGMPRARFWQALGEYYIDANSPDNAAWSEYARRLWRKYVAEFGHERSVGFSFVSDSNDVRTKARVRHAPYVYRLADGSVRYPPVFAMDIYGGAGTSERTIFEQHHHAMLAIGRNEPWIIAESYYNDPQAAEGLLGAMTATGRRVLYFTQWPLDRRIDRCDVNVSPPVDYDAWRQHGF